MSNMTYKYIVASQKKDFKDTVLYKSLCKNCLNFQNVIFFGENKESLASVYNKGIDQCRKEDINIAILVHDDVFINCADFETRIRKYANLYDVTGLAGNTTINIKEPVLWHLMSSRENLRGCVAHGDCVNYSYTSFGPVNKQVILIDGVFICININKLPEKVKFDESNPARYHFYDLMFSMDCCLNKVKVGVGDIPIIHASPGLRDMSEEWKSGQKYFLEKYKNYQGKTLTV